MSGILGHDPMTPDALPARAAFATLVRARRTSMFVDMDRSVPDSEIADLCDAAQWAPNHKRTWPWRFAAFSGDSRLRLGEAFVADMVATGVGDEGKRIKTLTKYARTPNVLVVGCAPSPTPNLAADDRDAVAAGIQTLLLAATTRGLASFWSTPAVTTPATVNELSRFPEGTRIVGVVYLGYAAESVLVPTPERPPVAITWNR